MASKRVQPIYKRVFFDRTLLVGVIFLAIAYIMLGTWVGAFSEAAAFVIGVVWAYRAATTNSHVVMRLLATLMGATRLEVTGKVLVPATLPWIFTGMRISVRYAFTNTLLAELIAANSGIGFMIEYYSGIFDATGTYAAILVLVIMSVGLTELLTQVEAIVARGRGR